jgi:hypothetical protein
MPQNQQFLCQCGAFLLAIFPQTRYHCAFRIYGQTRLRKRELRYAVLLIVPIPSTFVE